MGLKAKILPNYTYEDYLQWEGRWEIIDGIPYAMTPSPSPKHQALAGKIHSLFLSEIQNSQCNCEVYQPIDLRVDKHTIVQPDILIVCRPITKSYLDFPPELVVEIISPSTELKDRNTKFNIYQDFIIPNYILVDPDQEKIEKYVLVNDEYIPSDSFTFTLGCCEIQLDLNTIFG